ncbi:SPW repeat protein [Streptomyces sp. NPDC006173]|uniref:SPW repeat protein n=1 Tax=Streptomyces sp. NPDC006173 TaxID=3155349 RepID=UPI0033F9DAD4
MGIWTCIAPWVVSGDVAHTRSITSNLITGAIATVLALAAASATRDNNDRSHGMHPSAPHRSMPDDH